MKFTNFAIASFFLSSASPSSAGGIRGGKLNTQTNNENAVETKSRKLTYLDTEMAFGDITLTYTSEFELIYKDTGSGASLDGAFYRPTCPDGFYPFGDLGVGNHDSPDGEYAGVCAKVSDDAEDTEILAAPESYTWIWSDKGSGADMDGSCWRPEPPSGYVCLGDVCIEGYNEPDTDLYRCVKEDHVQYATIGDKIWSDRHSGGDYDFTARSIDQTASTPEDDVGYISLNTFTGYASYSDDGLTDVSFNLMIDLPKTIADATGNTPTLTEAVEPDETSGEYDQYVVTVPFTAVSDPDYDLEWQVEHSPFYTITKVSAYSLVGYVDNTGSSSSFSSMTTVTVGVSESSSNTFSEEAGIEIGAEVGIEAVGSMYMSLSYSFGYESTVGYGSFENTEREYDLDANAGCAAAIWIVHSAYEVRRGYDNSLVSSISFDDNASSYVHDDYCP